MKPYEKLKQARLSQKKTTYELSELTGIPQSTISKIENGKRKLDSESLTKITTALNIPVEFIFTDEPIANKGKWIDDILNGDNIIGIDKKSFLEADPSRREALLNDLSQISLFQAKINKLSDLVNKSDNEELKVAYFPLLQDITKELTIINELIKLLDAFYIFIESVNKLESLLNNPILTKNNKNISLNKYSSQILEANNNFYKSFMAYLKFPRNLVSSNWEERDKSFLNAIQSVIDFNNATIEVLNNGNKEE